MEWVGKAGLRHSVGWWALIKTGRCCCCCGPGPQLVKGAAADNTSAASERVVAIAVLSQLERSAEVLDKTALALALWSRMPRPSYSWFEAMLGSMPWRSAVVRARLRKKFWAAGPHPPNVSAIMGTRVSPAAAHCRAVRRSSNLWASYDLAAARGCWADSASSAACSGHVTAKSSATAPRPGQDWMTTSQAAGAPPRGASLQFHVLLRCLPRSVGRSIHL